MAVWVKQRNIEFNFVSDLNAMDINILQTPAQRLWERHLLCELGSD